MAEPDQDWRVANYGSSMNWSMLNVRSVLMLPTSRAYGFGPSRNHSDEDLRGVGIDPSDYHLHDVGGLRHNGRVYIGTTEESLFISRKDVTEIVKMYLHGEAMGQYVGALEQMIGKVVPYESLLPRWEGVGNIVSPISKLTYPLFRVPFDEGKEPDPDDEKARIIAVVGLVDLERGIAGKDCIAVSLYLTDLGANQDREDNVLEVMETVREVAYTRTV